MIFLECMCTHIFVTVDRSMIPQQMRDQTPHNSAGSAPPTRSAKRLRFPPESTGRGENASPQAGAPRGARCSGKSMPEGGKSRPSVLFRPAKTPHARPRVGPARAVEPCPWDTLASTCALARSRIPARKRTGRSVGCRIGARRSPLRHAAAAGYFLSGRECAAHTRCRASVRDGRELRRAAGAGEGRPCSRTARNHYSRRAKMHPHARENSAGNPDPAAVRPPGSR